MSNLQLSDYLKANDTMFYNDFDNIYHVSTALADHCYYKPWNETGTINELEEKRSETLLRMIHSKFAMWQVWTLHPELFIDSMIRVFDSYCDYYAEKILAYETQIRFLDGDSVTTSHDVTVTDTPRVETHTEMYDLPRSDTTLNRPSSKTISKPVSGTNVSENEGEVTRKGGNVIELKKKYLDLLRSVYEEFAERFRVNFIEMFDYDFKEVTP